MSDTECQQIFRRTSTECSFTKPNDAYIIRGLDQLPASYDSWDHDTKDLSAQSFGVSQLTRFTEEELKGKDLDVGEEFYFDGAEMTLDQDLAHEAVVELLA